MLFIDARKLGQLVDRTHRELTDNEVSRIAQTYHAWRGSSSTSSPSTGEKTSSPLPRWARVRVKVSNTPTSPAFANPPSLDDIRKHGHVLTPGRYVGAEAQESDAEPFVEKMKRLTATLREQQAEAGKLDAAITDNLRKLGYGG